MIQIVFPPGCYGHFLARCLFSFTNLDPAPFNDFSFDQTGSSHDIRRNPILRSKLTWQHVETFDAGASDQVIVILPEPDHLLDYYVNQFVKQEESQMIRHLIKQVESDEVKMKLTDNWNICFDDVGQVPRWAMREWLSFWIKDCVQSGYDRTKYESVNSVFKLGASALFENLLQVIQELSGVLELHVRVSDDDIQRQQCNFVRSQFLHNQQKRCEQWCHAVMHSEQNHEIMLHTIFEEAWIQHVLRVHDYQVKCDGLDVLPSSSKKMKSCVYIQ